MSSEQITKDTACTAADLKRWTVPISAAIGSAVLSELIRLIAEYLPLGLRFGSTRISKRVRIVNPDADGYGHRVRCVYVPPEEEREEKASPAGWYAALSAAPLIDVGVRNGRVAWTVTPLKKDMFAFTVGVGYRDAAKAMPVAGVDARSFGLCALKGEPWRLCHNGGWVDAGQLVPCAWRPPPVTLTANLKTNTLHFRIDYEVVRFGGLPTGERANARWSIRVPQLETAHALVSMNTGDSARLTQCD
jgi:hypothetical protein